MNYHQAAGLNETEVKCYEALLSVHDIKPAELAKRVNETRTNCYKVLDTLSSLGLAERFEKSKVWHYRATNPTRLLELARKRRAEQEQAERELEAKVQRLNQDYLKIHEQPGVRYYVGKDGIKDIYNDQVAVGKPVYFINTIDGIHFYSYETMSKLRTLAIDAGIPRYALTPDTEWARADYKKHDAQVKLTRTWLKADDYTAPVEWGVYGNKMYIISFGSEAMGMTIESTQIAESFRQIFKLLDRGQKALPDYDTLPRLVPKL